jgi:hypothetical protein
MNKFLALVAITGAVTLAGCSVAPYRFPDTPPRELVAIDSTHILVKEQFGYSGRLTSVVFPAGEYLPVRKDATGVYYESPRDVLILPVGGQRSLVRGGIYRRTDSARHEFAFYGGPIVKEALHNLSGLDLNRKIECTPACLFN